MGKRGRREEGGRKEGGRGEAKVGQLVALFTYLVDSQQ